MKIKFDANQHHQRRAWESAVGIFKGQELDKTLFSMPSLTKHEFEAYLTGKGERGYGNRLCLSPEEILENVQNIQLRNGLKQTKELKSLDFTIEMETGTGKTYVYLRSIFEMNKHYGFSKFIIVVPSIAIKEGVFKTLEMTKTHFKEQYENIPFDYFTYNSNRLEQVRSFAHNDYIQIMVINIDAFRKSFTDPSKETSANIIHRWNDKMQGIPIDLIQSTHPIVIIDEPQSVDTTTKSEEAIKSFHPLCIFRYSATHIDKHNMLYKLDAIDAYEQKLVKQIEVASIQVKDGHNKAYIKLLAVDNKKGHRAKIELDIQKKNTIKRSEKWVKQGDDLLNISGGRSLYDGYVVNDIYCEEGNEYIDFTSKPDIIALHHAIGDVNEDEYKRLQIRKTIEEHLDKELKLTPMGIKVLSLFFIDKVAHYRDYTAQEQKGKYALIFEEEYAKAIKKPKYNSLFSEMDTDSLPSQVHNGYFSCDKSGVKDTNGSTKADEDTYNLIMKDKEKLLSFDSKLKFIFSHSALKEGWDNPNVFQICTLNETKSTIKKRQEIGRGLRIAVNQDGERVHGFEVNTLTVMANESYEEFVDSLQKEIEKEEGLRFGIIEMHSFANILIEKENQEHTFLGAQASETIWYNLLEKQYIDQHSKITNELKKALQADNVVLPEQFEAQREAITAILKKTAGGLNIKNNEDKRTVRLNKAVFDSPEFKKLWNRIKYKTIYNVDFNPNELIKKCANSIRKNLVVGKTKFNYTRAKTEISKGGVNVAESQKSTHVYDVRDYKIPDILTYLQNETNLKRQSILSILRESGRLDDFKNNPQKFIDEVKRLITREMQRFIVDGIKYHKIGDEHFYAQELFEQEELIGYLNKNMIKANKATHDHVVYDSNIESSLAQSFEKNNEIKVYAKLPEWFKIDTPLGSYNPDWAILFEQDGKEKLYFVVESKGAIFEDMLRDMEKAKIHCGREHFKALGGNTQYIVTNNYETFLDQAIQKK
ncbi:DEAD/DEAH box helicase family protein [Bartonella krasnovii]|uniref:type III restriction-modification system endonuclease n=1 Tax=Bartonella krasnovii TaxID=2267275 RepID=UPI001F4CD561|nr:DEAD/DEAH box helicase family protein [Bartonella krasnovii]UNF51569.1 DEAD/DEAH box helicase family protein [Bartonella krasnovii]